MLCQLKPKRERKQDYLSFLFFVFSHFQSNRNSQFGDMGSNANNDHAMEWLWKRSEEITGERLCDLPNNFKFINENCNRFP